MEKRIIQNAILTMKKEFPFSENYLIGFENKYFHLISQISKYSSPGSKILSIGSGPCDFEAVLSKLGYDVTAIDDLSDPWHQIGDNKEKIIRFAKEMGINFIQDSAQQMSINNDYYDVVLLSGVIEHLHTNPRHFLNHFISLLKEGGIIIIETPNAVHLLNRIKVFIGKSNYADINLLFWTIGEYRSHIREYTAAELVTIFNYENLIKIDCQIANISINTIKFSTISEKIIKRTYLFITFFNSNLKDSIIISGMKPKNWSPTADSWKNFNRYYPNSFN